MSERRISDASRAEVDGDAIALRVSCRIVAVCRALTRLVVTALISR
jgi:hypothetical protein